MSSNPADTHRSTSPEQIAPTEAGKSKGRFQVESLEPRILMSAGMMDTGLDELLSQESNPQQFESSTPRVGLFDEVDSIDDPALDIILPYLAAGLAAEWNFDQEEKSRTATPKAAVKK